MVYELYLNKVATWKGSVSQIAALSNSCVSTHPPSPAPAQRRAAEFAAQGGGSPCRTPGPQILQHTHTLHSNTEPGIRTLTHIGPLLRLGGEWTQELSITFQGTTESLKGPDSHSWGCTLGLSLVVPYPPGSAQTSQSTPVCVGGASPLPHTVNTDVSIIIEFNI